MDFTQKIQHRRRNTIKKLVQRADIKKLSSRAIEMRTVNENMLHRQCTVTKFTLWLVLSFQKVTVSQVCMTYAGPMEKKFISTLSYSFESCISNSVFNGLQLIKNNL